MKENMIVEARIKRIELMESYFDCIKNTVKNEPDLLREDRKVRRMYRKLIDYYENGQWLDDYESDERGELPKSLKRGVLSEDGVYNLLLEVKEIFG